LHVVSPGTDAAPRPTHTTVERPPVTASDKSSEPDADELTELLRRHAVARLTAVSLEEGLAARRDGVEAERLDPLTAWRRRIPKPNRIDALRGPPSSPARAGCPARCDLVD
jgi:hypothetical protein